MENIPRKRPEWGDMEARLEAREPFGMRVEMGPGTAQVREALHLKFDVSPVEKTLEAGTDLLIMVPRTWKLDLNGAFPEISQFFAVWEGGYGNGRQCLVKAEAAGDVRTECELIPVGFEFLVYVRVSEGRLSPGERLTVHLAHPDGPRVRAPQTVQFHPFVTAVRPSDEELFRPLSALPGVRTFGGPTRFLRVTGPGVVGADETAVFKVVPMDRFEMNRGFDYGGTVTLSEVEGDGAAHSVRIGQEENFARVSIPLGNGAGFSYVRAQDVSRDLYGRSNPVGRPEAFGGYRVFFGDLHVHCRPCDGFGTMREAFDYAYEVSELDFASVSHQQNSGNFPFTHTHWQEYLEINESFDRKEGFATLPICETYSGYGHRHALFRNVRDAERFPVGQEVWGRNYRVPENRPENLWEVLKDFDALTFPHHLKFISATDFSTPPHPMEPVMEICSRWGSSEIGGAHSAQYALSQGRRLGFIGGTDNHLGQPGSGTHGYNEGRGWMGVLAERLDREAIFDAIRGRRCYATSGAKILVFFALDTHPMGEEVSGWRGERRFHVRAAGTGPLEKVEVIRNGEAVRSLEHDGYTVDTVYTDSDPLEGLFQTPAFPGLAPFVYYYLRITQRDRNQAWSSPIWVSP